MYDCVHVVRLARSSTDVSDTLDAGIYERLSTAVDMHMSHGRYMDYIGCMVRLWASKADLECMTGASCAWRRVHTRTHSPGHTHTRCHSHHPNAPGRGGHVHFAAQVRPAPPL